ncbi:uncharacterized protein M421DRAFT_278850 [Didymella exigua CBS 183.55]|uniref:Uncharacterized protein n=1 Tax=Didymella exigua CBS 183.55 TaxID=1150837 RepID=A0A6A5R8A9_9PLEO|nr:uncharacterized protein M421DRAFT_278850 [Didymella exigua CBS 183.55]KAF1924441.1 hypothetical protein M421DRAFT_278850 [Didymella exigua CBS 183.55]
MPAKTQANVSGIAQAPVAKLASNRRSSSRQGPTCSLATRPSPADLCVPFKSSQPSPPAPLACTQALLHSRHLLRLTPRL